MACRKRFPRGPVLLRGRGLAGPFFQPQGQRLCVRGPGHAFAPGGGLSAPRAIALTSPDSTTLRVTFSQCVSVSGVTGVTYTVDGGAPVAPTAVVQVSDTVWDYTVTALSPGETVTWQYAGGSIADCVDAEEIGSQGPLLYVVPGTPGYIPVFLALVPDEVTHEMLGVETGTGGLSEARVSDIQVPDSQGILYSFPAATPAWQGGRVTGTYPNYTVYGDNGSGVRLDPPPSVVYAPQATNYLHYNSEPTGLGWVISGLVATGSGFTAPDNSLRPSSLVENTGNSKHEIFQSRVGSERRKAVSAYVANSVGTRFISLGCRGTATHTLVAYVTVDPRLGVVTEQGSAAENVSIVPAGNGFFRVSFEYDDVDDTVSGARLSLAPTGTPGSGSVGYIGDGASSVLGWGAQQEADTVTPVIATVGASVTRDACALGFDSANSGTSGTWYGEFLLSTDDASLLNGFLAYTAGDVVLSDGTSAQALTAASGWRKVGLVYGAGTMRLNVDGVWATEGPYDGDLLQGALDLFRGALVAGAARNLQRYAEKDEGVVDGLMA